MHVSLNSEWLICTLLNRCAYSKPLSLRDPHSQVLATHSDNSHIPYVYYDLPDNSSAPIGIERFRVPEILFDPSTVCEALSFKLFPSRY